ncbi:hypothetical protein NXY41_16595 [Bacteroides fragilis]|nr:hypothetical protein [Bacteroides fragilis]MCS2880167.1 hypothetical protein [Bacteroides fragilis]
MKVDISTIVMLLTEEDLLEKCAISNFEFCIENVLRYIENRDLFNPDFFLFQLEKQTVKLLNCIESDLIDQSSAIRLRGLLQEDFSEASVILLLMRISS